MQLLVDEQLKALCTFVEGRDVFFFNWLCMLLPLVFDCLRLESDYKSIIVAVSPPITLMEAQVASSESTGVKC